MNCQPGDLAIVVSSTIQQNIGKIVDVVKAYDPQDAGILPTNESRQLWLCETKGSLLRWASPDGHGVIHQSAGPIPDEFLRPLRDDEPTEPSNTSKVVPVEPVAVVI